MPTLTIIIGSTRPGRASLPIARWFADRAEAHGGFDVDVADLAELALPLLDEPHHPRLGRYEHEHTRRWSAIADASDAFVLITPEYNHGYPAALKNAIDYLHREWQHKPVGFVSYGGVAAGTRAVQQLKPVLAALNMHPLTAAVSIPFHAQLIDRDAGTLRANDVMTQAADAMLDELARTQRVLQALRAEPAVA